jgi:predicted lipoprotein with Yx(FWY)xxD motif
VQEEGAHDCQVVGEDGEAQWAHQGVGLLRYGSN